MMGTMIPGDRVRLRRIERADLPRFVEWLGDPEVREGMALVYPLGLVQEERWFESTLALEPALQPFAVDARSIALEPPAGTAPDWTHIGVLGFHAIDWRNRHGEIGIVIGNRTFWGRGYGGEALRALVGWGFSELNLHRVWLRVYEDNSRAVRCYEKLGFRLEGCLREDRFHAGRYGNTLLMGLLSDELRA
jgi:RimJ/RimL family protein N-acetyltransferase